MNALLCRNRTDCQWRFPPIAFPAWPAVFHHFTLCEVTAAAGAVIALGLVPRGRPQTTGGPHVH